MQEFVRKLCPLCGTRQRLELNAGVQIFYCPQCRAKQCWDSNVLNSPIMLMQEHGSTVVPPTAAKAGSVGTGAHEQPMSRPKKIAWAIFTLVMMAVLLPKKLIPENLIPKNLLPDINNVTDTVHRREVVELSIRGDELSREWEEYVANYSGYPGIIVLCSSG